MADTSEKTPPDSGATTHFGFREVAEDEKATLVRDVFDSVASRYDLMNDLMSGGVHRLWKADLVGEIAPRPGEKLLDVAGGTGDIAFRFVDAAGGAESGATAILCDINYEMLHVGRDRAIDTAHLNGFSWVTGDAEKLPVKSASVDVYTIAFGLRNVTRIDAALAEARRVLKPGGRFFCLEFSRVVVPVLDKLYDLYSFNVLPAIGAAVAGDRAAYQYLAESIRRFPPQQELVQRMERAGLERARFRNLSGGIAAIHAAWRI
jgi:demethylmenaquinone methyltransferase/2-methoxy-6-polyprenyl-1,4-benzoquinol methylase